MFLYERSIIAFLELKRQKLAVARAVYIMIHSYDSSQLRGVRSLGRLNEVEHAFRK